MELGDKMDLASYLLKPIQRMSKYALLLKDLIKECSQSQEQELSDLRTAEEMVKFQLRHGNDLLAMDAIRGCDVSSNDPPHATPRSRGERRCVVLSDAFPPQVNLKEQGQLRCQDEFIVWCGRRKYLRHIFLFEDLILFSKTKKIEGGYDFYIYKQSFKVRLFLFLLVCGAIREVNPPFFFFCADSGDRHDGECWRQRPSF